MTSVALFNNKGGAGKTTLTYHLAHMLQRLGHRVLAVDLDPQSNLTAQFLPEDTIARLLGDSENAEWREPENKLDSRAS
jgi:cellulose biosynthesis protein BcsQ